MRAPVLLMALAWCSGTLGAVLLLAGALDAGLASVVPLRPARLLLASAFSFVLARRLARRSIADVLDDSRTSGLLAAALLCVLGVLLIKTGVDSVGGADSAGYLLQAERWRHGALVEPLMFQDLPVRNPEWLQSPLGFRPAPNGDATVPTYPPGLPLLEAFALVGGHTMATRVLPAAFALTAIAALYALGRATQRPHGALLGAAMFAFSPPFLFQALQPMSDVPALAAWLVALASALRGGRAWRLVSGIAVALAIAVRPNLAPLLLVVAWAAAREARSLASTLRLSAPIVVPGVLMAGAYVALQYRLYGTPWQSGYGTASELFALKHVWPNLSHQAAWVLETHPWPALIALLVGLLFAWRGRIVARPAAVAALVVWLLYATYVPFDNWTYLRFVLLPLAIAALGASGFLADLTSRYGVPTRWALLTTVLVVVVATNLVAARRLDVFDLHRHEARYRLAGDFVRTHAPPSSVVLASQHATAVAAYTSLPVLRLDLLHAEDASALLDWLRARRHPVVIVLDDDERDRVLEPLVRSHSLTLDWPARAHVGLPVRTRVWFLDDRERVRSGMRVPTTTLRPRRR